MCTWLGDFGCDTSIGLLLSDISGAIDGVESIRLIDECWAACVDDVFCGFFGAYLAPRSAFAVVDGCRPRKATIKDQAFQGTVLGPPLWNVFFRDIEFVTCRHGFREAKFADDLSVFKAFDAQMKQRQNYWRTRGHAS